MHISPNKRLLFTDVSNRAPNFKKQNTFRYPGMPPTNNKSERTLRRPVLHRKIRLMFRTDTVRWDDQDQNLLQNIHRTITA
ncbi:MAG: transposase [Cenarchaeum sp. SB0678_bin_8]|nr:transposase [Cenarchaeum sp. SB0678_bin_8]